MSDALKALGDQLFETIEHKRILRIALINTHSLLNTLGTPDDAIVQTALAENDKALAATGYWSPKLQAHYRSNPFHTPIKS